MNVNVPIVGDPPLGHAKRRAKIREAIRLLDVDALVAIRKKHGAWHTLEAMQQDANAYEQRGLLPDLIGALLSRINDVEQERDMWRNHCSELAEIQKQAAKPDDIPF